ncbi:cell adhesion molecule 2-like [Haliotis rufescens]|uniref:cell adhesion molecule 2-like n=1 Tax=Haliotis rufescens TaxID=6454 RepID=UPI00201F5873|nr:cell adhesion molecule 2-like [Haliotis rufescens]
MAAFCAFVFLLGVALCHATRQPEFLSSTKTVTARKGDAVTLPCSFNSLGRHRVVWTDGQFVLLTYQDRRVYHDERLSVIRPSVGEWNLEIRALTMTDQGQYHCIINTSPLRDISVNLIVTERN